ncbi:hypothetical protein MYAM1_001076 [Malassezia yamatoensis]|uniref:Uncharacterized protein n=1 Tax=Malassezia yamatoensis TaxID=253288 RepID=A0AAJ6CGK7_9BASI|nr:hypothetical protein MYAM1_001076 [Malassezia yamatoensis]
MSDTTMLHVMQLKPDSMHNLKKSMGEDLRSLCDMLPILLSRLTNQMRELTNILYCCALNATDTIIPWNRYQEVQKDTQENATKLVHVITSLKQELDRYLSSEKQSEYSLQSQRTNGTTSNCHLAGSSQVNDERQTSVAQGIGLSPEVHALLTADLIPSPRNAGSRSYASERGLDFQSIYLSFTHHLQSLKQTLTTPNKISSSLETPWLEALRGTLEYAGSVLILLDDIDLAKPQGFFHSPQTQSKLSQRSPSKIYGHERYQSARQRFANSANSCLVVAQRVLDLRQGSTAAAYHELADKTRLLEADAGFLLQSLQQCLLRERGIPLTTVSAQHLQEEPTSSKSSAPSPPSSSQTWASNTRASLSSVDSSQRGINICSDRRLKPESFASSTENTKGLVWDKDNLIKGGTFTALVDYLLDPRLANAEHEFCATFLATLPTFATFEQLLDMVISRYHFQLEIRDDASYREEWISLVQQPTRLHILNVLIQWLENWWIVGNFVSLDVLISFLQEHVGDDIYSEAKETLLRLIHRCKQGLCKPMQFPQTMSSVPFPILPSDLKVGRFKDMNPLEVARQVTLLESKQFVRIKFIEWLSRTCSRPSLQPEKQEISKMIALHNKITRWVEVVILSENNISKRSRILEQFILIADCCRMLNNFSSMWAIVMGLNSAAVYRLRKTWDLISAATKSVFERINTITQSTRNYACYRELLHRVEPPCVPFCGLYTRDLTFIGEGNPDFLDSHSQIINFSKRRRTAQIVTEVRRFQDVPYNLMHVPVIETYLLANFVDAEDDQKRFERSLKLEPRVGYATKLTQFGTWRGKAF